MGRRVIKTLCDIRAWMPQLEAYVRIPSLGVSGDYFVEIISIEYCRPARMRPTEWPAGDQLGSGVIVITPLPLNLRVCIYPCGRNVEKTYTPIAAPVQRIQINKLEISKNTRLLSAANQPIRKTPKAVQKPIRTRGSSVLTWRSSFRSAAPCTLKRSLGT